MEWQKNAYNLHAFIGDVVPTPPGISFTRPAWVKLNRLQTGAGLFRSETHKWGMISTAACECGAKEQTAKHIIRSCLIYHHLNEARVLSDVKKKLMSWLMDTRPANYWTMQLSSISPKGRRRKTGDFIKLKMYIQLMAFTKCSSHK